MMVELDLGLFVVGSTVLVLGISSWLASNRWSVSDPLLALGIGVLGGPSRSGSFGLEAPTSSLLSTRGEALGP